MTSPPTDSRRPILGQGKILEILSPGLVRIRMPNGYETLAHWSKRSREPAPDLSVGDEVSLEFSAYDMTRARILPIDR